MLHSRKSYWDPTGITHESHGLTLHNCTCFLCQLFAPHDWPWQQTPNMFDIQHSVQHLGCLIWLWFESKLAHTPSLLVAALVLQVTRFIVGCSPLDGQFSCFTTAAWYLFTPTKMCLKMRVVMSFTELLSIPHHWNGTCKWVRMNYVASLLPKDARRRVALSDLTISSKRDVCFQPSMQYPSRIYFARSKSAGLSSLCGWLSIVQCQESWRVYFDKIFFATLPNLHSDGHTLKKCLDDDTRKRTVTLSDWTILTNRDMCFWPQTQYLSRIYFNILSFILLMSKNIDVSTRVDASCPWNWMQCHSVSFFELSELFWWW